METSDSSTARQALLSRWTRIRQVALWTGGGIMLLSVVGMVLVSFGYLDVRFVGVLLLLFVLCRVVRTHAERRVDALEAERTTG